MSTNQTPILSRELTNDRISTPYPHVEVMDPSDALALVLLSMSEGELPVLCTFNGSTRKLKSIRQSAIVLLQLSKVAKLTYHKSADATTELNTIDDIMGVLA